MTTSDNLSERIRFEAWAAPRGADTTYDSDNGYVNPDTAIAFSAWQARAAQLEAELDNLRRQLAALQPQPAVGIGNENPRMSYDKLSDILIIRNGDRDSYIRYIDGDIALVCEVNTDKVVGFEVEGFSIRAGLDRQPQPAPSPADTEAVREMFDEWAINNGFDTARFVDLPLAYSSYMTRPAWFGYLAGYRRAFAAHAAAKKFSTK